MIVYYFGTTASHLRVAVSRNILKKIVITHVIVMAGGRISAHVTARVAACLCYLNTRR